MTVFIGGDFDSMENVMHWLPNVISRAAISQCFLKYGTLRKLRLLITSFSSSNCSYRNWKHTQTHFPHI